MPLGYLVLASDRRLLHVTFDSEPYTIQRTIGCRTAEHSATTATTDQLIVNGDPVERISDHWFRMAGVSFPFCGNALLIGVNPLDGSTADWPVMTIDEFRSMVTFVPKPNFRRKSWSG